MANRQFPYGRGRDIGAGIPLDIANRGVLRPRGEGGTAAPAGAPMFERRQRPQKVIAVAPANEFPIPSAQMLFAHAETLTLAAGAGSVIAGPSFQLPQGNVGVINGVTLFINSPDTTTDIIFTLLINDAPVPGLDALSEFPRVANNLDRTFAAAVLVPNGGLIEGLITNQSAAGPWTVGMDFVGWHMPERDVEAYTGQPWGRI
jgi:hypothetical protein